MTQRGFALLCLRDAAEALDAQRAAREAAASAMRRRGLKELADAEDKRWNTLSASAGAVRRMIEVLEAGGQIVVE